jgi:hypothetical protein
LKPGPGGRAIGAFCSPSVVPTQGGNVRRGGRNDREHVRNSSGLARRRADPLRSDRCPRHDPSRVSGVDADRDPTASSTSRKRRSQSATAATPRVKRSQEYLISHGGSARRPRRLGGAYLLRYAQESSWREPVSTVPGYPIWGTPECVKRSRKPLLQCPIFRRVFRCSDGLMTCTLYILRTARPGSCVHVV